MRWRQGGWKKGERLLCSLCSLLFSLSLSLSPPTGKKGKMLLSLILKSFMLAPGSAPIWIRKLGMRFASLASLLCFHPPFFWPWVQFVCFPSQPHESRNGWWRDCKPSSIPDYNFRIEVYLQLRDCWFGHSGCPWIAMTERKQLYSRSGGSKASTLKESGLVNESISWINLIHGLNQPIDWHVA